MSDQAASTTPTPPPSPGGQPPSPSPAPAPGDGSNPTPTAARPDYVPEAFWDPTAGAVKAAEFTTHIGELAALKAAQDARLAARPKDPSGYELKLPETFKSDVALKFDETDPRVAPLRAFAHELSLDQAGFSKLLEIEAARVVAENKAVEAAQAAQIAKLGTNGTARVTAAKTGLAGILGADTAAQIMDRMVMATDVEAIEKLLAAFTNQGGSTYRGNGREPPPQAKPPLEKLLWPKRQAAL